MSVLSSPQGTPERVWSLIGALNALGGEASREDFSALLNPGYMRGGDLVKADPALAADATGAAGALGLFERAGSQVRLPDGERPLTPSQLADRAHDVLCQAKADDADRVILEAYAWLVATSAQRQDINWMFDVGQKEFADMVDAGLIGDDKGGRLMNSTKITPWRRWLRFLGLGAPMPDGTIDFPTPATRIALELKRAGVREGTTLPAEEFLWLLARRCPYLDRGRLFVQACERIGFTPPPRGLSALLSCGLRDLQADGVISLNLSGDAADSVSLIGDPVAFGMTFNSVTILARGEQP